MAIASTEASIDVVVAADADRVSGASVASISSLVTLSAMVAVAALY
jgi:hypothetical protein